MIRSEEREAETPDREYERMWHLSAQFVHDIRNPLLSNLAAGEAIQMHWKSLIDAYEAAAAYGLVDKSLSQAELRNLDIVVNGMTGETQLGRELVENYWREVKGSLPLPDTPWRGDGGETVRRLREELKGK